MTPSTKAQFGELARRRGVSESVALRQLIESTLQSAGIASSEIGTDGASEVRSARLMVRLLPDDRRLLTERATARGMPAATYVSSLVRSHLTELAPLPAAELAALKRVTAELGAVGRSLNLIAKAAHQGRVSGPSRDDLRALLRACEALRSHVNGLIHANLESWDIGYAPANR